MNREDFEKHVISEARQMLKEEADKKRQELKNITLDDIKSLTEQCKIVTNSYEFNDKFVAEDAKPKQKLIPTEQTSRFSNLVEYQVVPDGDRDILSEVIQEERVFNEIKLALEAEMHKIQEVSMLEEAITDVLKRYLRRGVLTVAIMANLLGTNLASAQQLEQAGIDPDKIEMAAEKAGIDVQGKPDVFNFGIVRGMFVQDTLTNQNISDMKASIDVSDYQYGSDIGGIAVPYTLKTSEKLSAGWGHQLSRSYDAYKTDTVKGVTDNKNYVVVASEDESPIIYTVSDYPQEITNNGETMQFVGFFIIKSNPRNKNAFYDKKGVNFAKLKGGSKDFIAAPGKTSFSVKGNSISIGLVYGKGIEGNETPGDSTSTEQLSVKENDLFKYNRTTVQTDKDSYKEMINQIEVFVEKYPEAKFEITVHGNSSQVPTSYDNTKDNNNLGDNFKSLPGQAGVDNNKMLAQDRADALLKQVLVDLKVKDPDILKRITGVNTTSKIGDIEYANDPQNAQKYAPDQFANITLKTVK